MITKEFVMRFGMLWLYGMGIALSFIFAGSFIKENIGATFFFILVGVLSYFSCINFIMKMRDKK